MKKLTLSFEKVAPYFLVTLAASNLFFHVKKMSEDSLKGLFLICLCTLISFFVSSRRNRSLKIFFSLCLVELLVSKANLSIVELVCFFSSFVFLFELAKDRKENYLNYFLCIISFLLFIFIYFYFNVFSSFFIVFVFSFLNLNKDLIYFIKKYGYQFLAFAITLTFIFYELSTLENFYLNAFKSNSALILFPLGFLFFDFKNKATFFLIGLFFYYFFAGLFGANPNSILLIPSSMLFCFLFCIEEKKILANQYILIFLWFIFGGA